MSAALVAVDVSRASDAERNAAHAGGRVPGDRASVTGSTATASIAPAVASASADPSASADLSAPPVVAQYGPGSFAFAPGPGPVVGRSGGVQRYRVAVENGVGVAPETFAAAVDAILADPRGWTAGGDLRLQRVSGGAAAAFTVYLATPATSEEMCRDGFMETAQYTNCRLSDGRVVINLARWLTAVPGYGAPLEVYQAYAINHEVGHQFRQWHELCPAPGRPAPVMQQQTLGLQGCVANGWPYLDGVRYRGPAASQ